MTKQRVVLIGASNKPERYAYMAFKDLQKHGHKIIPVHPTLPAIEGVPVLHDLQTIKEAIDTVTLYVNPEIGLAMKDALIALHPARIIMNPGTEHPGLEQQLQDAGIKVLHACTLVLLRTNQF